MELCILIFILMMLFLVIAIFTWTNNTTTRIDGNRTEIDKIKQRIHRLEQKVSGSAETQRDATPDAAMPLTEKPKQAPAKMTETVRPEQYPPYGSEPDLDFEIEEVGVRKESKMPEPQKEREPSSDDSFVGSITALLHQRKQKPATDSQATANVEEESTFEQILAGQWLSWLGAVTIIIGAGFFFKYTIDMGWIGARERVLIGIVTGLLSFGGGIWAMRRDYRYVSQGLVGTAMGILYFSIFAAVEWYGLVPVHVGLAGLSLVTAMSLGFAAWSDTQATALLGMFGGYLTPLMLWPGAHSLHSLFAYLFALNLGIILVTTLRKWSWLQLLALIGTALAWTTWLGRHYDPVHVKETLLWMSVFFGQFALLSVWNHLVQKREVEAFDLIVMLATPFIYLGGFLWITQEAWNDTQGVVAFSMAVVYGVLAAICRYRVPGNKRLIGIQAGLSAIFLILAVPLHFEGHWIPILWTAQSVMLVLVGFRMRDVRVRGIGLILLMIVQLFLVFYSAESLGNPHKGYWNFVKQQAVIPAGNFAYQFAFLDLFNERSMCFLASFTALVLLGVIYRRQAEHKSAEVQGPYPERWHFFSDDFGSEMLAVSGTLIIGAILTFMVLVFNESYMIGHLMDWIRQAYAPLISILLAVTALISWLYFSRYKPHGGLMLVYWLIFAGTLCLTAGCMSTLIEWKDVFPVALDPQRYYQFWQLPVLNLRFLGHGTLILIAAWFCRRASRLKSLFPMTPPDTNEVHLSARTWKTVFGAFTLLASFALVTLEAYAIGVQREWGTGTSLSITAVWIGFGLLL
ncbi:MAG: hypothetical protein CMJ46_02675, partial [Planctomyces sp.]|nr:hypothetical protein [Planctomyces sp.]